MRKFNIGDRIKVIGNCNGHGYEIGREYTIKCHPLYLIEPNVNGYAYILDANVDSDIIGEIIREKDMELVKPKEPVLFMNHNGLEVKCQNITVDKYEKQIDCYNKIFNKEEYDLYVKGEWKEMKNEVLELWYKRENAKLKSEFKSEIEKYVNEHPIVVKYKEIVNAYRDSMSTLLEEYADFDIVSHISYSVLDDVDLHNIEKKLQDMYLKDNVTEHEKMLSKLQDTYETIKAMLSLSDDLEYQLDVLSKYKVIDKKTKKMVD